MAAQLDELGRPITAPTEEFSAGGVVSRIRDVEALVLYGKFPYVVVQTEDGLLGIGECDVFSAKVVKPAVEQILKPLLVGKNALDTGALWDQMSEALQRASMFGGALAGADIALWDIAGKALGAPIHQLLGGKRRDRVRFYASSMLRTLSADEEAERVAQMVDRGWTAYKLHGALPGRIDALASVLRLPLTVNNIQPTIATVAHLHFLASSTNAPYAQEYNIEHIPVRDETPILLEPLEVEQGGYIRVPDKPGLGVEVDLALMRKLAE